MPLPLVPDCHECTAAESVTGRHIPSASAFLRESSYVPTSAFCASLDSQPYRAGHFCAAASVNFSAGFKYFFALNYAAHVVKN
jgi:hypothetical protein